MTRSESQKRSDDLRGIDWWNALDERLRRRWLDYADSARPVDAWRAYKRAQGMNHG